MLKKIVVGFLTASSMLGPVAVAAAALTDITVFSSDSTGNNWNGMIWNTQGGNPPDTRGIYNLYVTRDSLSVLSPTFINGFNDSRTSVSIPLVTGDQTFSIYGNGIGITMNALQHFVLNLYFDGTQAAPGISGVQNLTNTNLAAAGHPNGLDIFGNLGHQEAGSLSTIIGGQIITLTAFSWITESQRDIVWIHWANDAPYSNGGHGFDYYGSFTLNVRAVPEPGSLALLGLGLLGLGVTRRKAA